MAAPFPSQSPAFSPFPAPQPQQQQQFSPFPMPPVNAASPYGPPPTSPYGAPPSPYLPTQFGCGTDKQPLQSHQKEKANTLNLFA